MDSINNPSLDDWLLFDKRAISNIDARSERFRSLMVPRNWDSIPAWYSDAVMTAAEKHRDSHWPHPTARDLIDYYQTGNRERYEAVVRERQSRLTTFALAALMTGDDEWLGHVLDGSVALCEQLSWCWPAHDDAFERAGSVFPVRGAPYVDLGASEVASQLAWICNVLGSLIEKIAPGFVALVREEIVQRVFLPRLERTDWKWLGITRPPNNWLAWIDSNLLGAVLAIFDGSDTHRAIVSRCSQGVTRFLRTIPYDGAIDEGFSYWWVGVGKALHALDLIRGPSGTPPVSDVVETWLRNLTSFPDTMWLGSEWFVSYADSVPKPPEPIPWHILIRAAQGGRNDRVLRVVKAMQDRQVGQYCPEWGFFSNLDFVASVLQVDVGEALEVDRPKGEAVFLSRQIAMLRERPGSFEGFCAMIKGGDNDESHNHLDIGTVTLSLDGVPVLADLGREMYERKTFGPHRYDIWYVQSQWHNVPRIDGSDQCAGKEWCGTDFEITYDVNEPSASLDLTEAYPGNGFSWTRSVVMDRRLGEAVGVEDISGVYEPELFFVVAGTCRVGGATVEVELMTGNRKVLLEFPDAHISSEVRRLTDPLMRHCWGDKVTRLCVTLPSAHAPSRYQWRASVCKTQEEKLRNEAGAFQGAES